MNNEEILEAAIEKVKANGYNLPGNLIIKVFPSGVVLADHISVEAILFSHKFAKVFWGEPAPEKTVNGIVTQKGSMGWRYHLQRLVLEEDPIKYLEPFLDD